MFILFSQCDYQFSRASTHHMVSKEASAMATKPSHILWTLIGMMRGPSFLLWTWHSQASSNPPAAVRMEHTHLGKVRPSLEGPVEESEPAHGLRPVFCYSSPGGNSGWCFLRSTIPKTPLFFLLFHIILTSLGFWGRLWSDCCPWISTIHSYLNRSLLATPHHLY